MVERRDERVLETLTAVIDPCSLACNLGMDIVEMGLVREAYVDATRTCHVTLVLTAITCFQVPTIERGIADAVVGAGLADAVKVTIDHRHLWDPELMSEAARERVEARRNHSRAVTGVRRRQWQTTDEQQADVQGSDVARDIAAATDEMRR